MKLKKYYEYYNIDDDKESHPETLPEITGKQGSAIIDISVSPNGAYIASVDGRLHLWSKQGNRLRNIYTPSRLTSVSFNNNNKTVVTGNVNGVVQEWDILTGKIIRNFLKT